MNEWTIGRRQASCGTCASLYAEGERHVSVLALRETDLARDDVCESCWTAREWPDTIYFWFTRYASDRRKLSLDLATLEDLFLRLEGRTQRAVLELRYVLCLLLMRKKRLKLERVMRGGPARVAGDDPTTLAHEELIVRRPRRDEAWHVQVFDFSAERAQELRADLCRVLDGLVTELAEPVGALPAGEPEPVL